jgi:hypothetical protein
VGLVFEKLAEMRREPARSLWVRSQAVRDDTVRFGVIPEHGGRVLRVVLNVVAAPIRVVTVYFDRSQIGKL